MLENTIAISMLYVMIGLFIAGPMLEAKDKDFLFYMLFWLPLVLKILIKEIIKGVKKILFEDWD